MKGLRIGVAAAALIASDASTVTPVEKVIQLMEGMLAKGRKEKEDEATQQTAYVQFCDDTHVEKQRSIDEANEKIEQLQADIQKYTNTAKKLAKEIAVHEGDVAAWEGDEKAATAVRTIERTDYDTTHKDYSESIDALGRAIKVLKEQQKDTAQAAFVQVSQVSALRSLRLMPAEAKAAITSFISEADEARMLESGSNPPEALGYEFQSTGIVEMLEGLLDKFVAEKTALEDEERNSKQAYQMLMQDLAAQLGQANADIKRKSEDKAENLANKATAEGDIDDTEASRDEDKRYLRDMLATCEQKAADFANRQKLREEELVAIQKAIDIISDQSVKGSAEKHLPALVQSQALAQLRAGAMDDNQARAVQILKSRAKKLNSRILAALAVRAEADPFVKVRKMIKDLLVRLMEEANEEADQKGFCDEELSKNEQTRKLKTERVEALTAENEELAASIAKLTEEMTTLNDEIAKLTSEMAEATEIRLNEKKKNKETIKDAAAAQVAVAQATTVLKEFYAKSSQATSFAQQEPPASFTEPYTGMGGENGGVVGMLEVISSDFARLEADTSAAEATAAREYDQLMSESKDAKDAKAEDIEHKTFKKQDKEQALTVNEEDLAGTQKELDAALQYFEKLKPSCLDSGVSYEERVKRREEEIESLQEALKALNGPEE